MKWTVKHIDFGLVDDEGSEGNIDADYLHKEYDIPYSSFGCGDISELCETIRRKTGLSTKRVSFDIMCQVTVAPNDGLEIA